VTATAAHTARIANPNFIVYLLLEQSPALASAARLTVDR
jgi:hypothetical protein